jgi:hypothetical protein
MRKRRNPHKMFLENVLESSHLEEERDGRIMLTFIMWETEI